MGSAARLSTNESQVWRAEVSDAKRLKAREDENAKLKKLPAAAMPFANRRMKRWNDVNLEALDAEPALSVRFADIRPFRARPAEHAPAAHLPAAPFRNLSSERTGDDWSVSRSHLRIDIIH